MIIESDEIIFSSIIAENGSKYVYYRWDPSFSGDNKKVKIVELGDHTFYIKDKFNNKGMCSITVGNPALDCPNGYYRSSYPITSDLACMKIEEGCQSNICYIGADDIGEK